MEPAVIRPAGETVMCPRDGRVGTSYVDIVDEQGAGPSTHMLSYTWGYTIGDIVDALANWCQAEGAGS